MTPEEVVQHHESLIQYHVNRYARLIPDWEREDLAQEARTAVWKFALKRPGNDLSNGGASTAIKFALGQKRNNWQRRTKERKAVLQPFHYETLLEKNNYEWEDRLGELGVVDETEPPFDPEAILGIPLSSEESYLCHRVGLGDTLKEAGADLGWGESMTRRRWTLMKQRMKGAAE